MPKWHELLYQLQRLHGRPAGPQRARALAMLFHLLLGILTLTTPGAPRCLNQYGKTACGYQCLAAHGEVACANTPDGICNADGGTVTCWDPPESVRAYYRDRVPRPECRSRAGKVACGYRCQTHDNDVACATTPEGICGVSYDGITCWDPPTWAWCGASRMPRASCVTLDHQTACGYQCVARSGHVGCASTPGGSCTTERGNVICIDPPPLPPCATSPCTDETLIPTWCRR